MRVAIMQPYVFPYLGYYQLLKAADVFVCFDDVNFIKKGWINRNRILLNGAPYTFTIPIQGLSQNSTIRASMLADDQSWKAKLVGNIQHAYRKAPSFEAVFPQLQDLIRTAEGSIADLAEASLRMVVTYLQLPVSIHRSSTLAIPADVKAQDRIIQVAKAHKATRYINPANGAGMYSEDRFAQEGMELRFLRMNSHVRYTQQGSGAFEPGLSMLDVLMNCSVEQVRELLDQHTLLTPSEVAAIAAPEPDRSA
jgi:WbqC-like protein family